MSNENNKQAAPVAQGLTDEQIWEIWDGCSGRISDFARAILAQAAPRASAQQAEPVAAWRANVASQCRTTASSDLAGQISVDAGSGTLRELLNDAADALAAPAPSASPALPERDTSKPAERQGLFRKFDVRRTDGSDAPGGKHHGCRYFVLDVDHDAFAAAALGAYAAACEATHPELARDLREKWGASPAALTDEQIERIASMNGLNIRAYRALDAGVFFKAARALLAASPAALMERTQDILTGNLECLEFCADVVKSMGHDSMAEGLLAVRYAIQQLAALPADQGEDARWIPVDERLPDAEKDVLVRTEAGYDVAGLFRGEWMSHVTQDYCKYHVTHWRLIDADMSASKEGA